MRFFLDTPTDTNAKEVNSKATHCYQELEFPISNEFCMVVYIIPRTDNSVFVATCWDSTFDMLLTDEDAFSTAVDTWPTLAALVSNGLHDKYREGALIQLEDSDYGENKWFLASVAGNINFKDEDWLSNDRLNEIMEVVMSKSVELATELQQKKPSMLRAIGKGIVSGALVAAAIFLGGDAST